MITPAILNTLVADDTIKAVTILCDDIGLADIRLFIVHEYEDKESIHFLGKSQTTGLSLFLLHQAESEIEKLLDLALW